MKIKEDFLHYLWKFKLFNTFNLITHDGFAIEVINFGMHNADAGPDFFNGKVKIGKTLWVGNIEMHINSSDWTKHKHQEDKAYDNVILHVVYHNDAAIIDKDGNNIPTLELKNLICKEILTKYENLVLLSNSTIPCREQLNTVDAFTIQSWINRLAIERLERKSEEIKQTLQNNKNNWEETFYQYLLKYFGLKVNALPFELLAKNTSLKIIEKHPNLLTIEALLFGQAGYLEGSTEDDYFQKLKQEYLFLKAKFELTPLDISVWKFLRLRPPNFPTLRIAQLSNLLFKETRLFSKLIRLETVKEIQEFFNVAASGYWNSHYQFGKLVDANKKKKMGSASINTIIINVIVPFTFVYGKKNQQEELVDKAIKLLESVKAESNSIVNQWNKLGIKSINAMQSQSLIELKNNYCSQKKCLNCSIGNKILQQ
jgi:hypothetical protein